MGMHFQDLRELAHVIVRFIFERSWQDDTFRAMNIVYFGFNKTFSSQVQREMQVLHVGSDYFMHLCSVLVRPFLECCGLFWTPPYKVHMDTLK